MDDYFGSRFCHYGIYGQNIDERYALFSLGIGILAHVSGSLRPRRVNLEKRTNFKNPSFYGAVNASGYGANFSFDVFLPDVFLLLCPLLLVSKPIIITSAVVKEYTAYVSSRSFRS